MATSVGRTGKQKSKDDTDDSYNGFSNKETFAVWHWVNLDPELFMLMHRYLQRNDPSSSIKDYFTNQSLLMVEARLPVKKALMMVDIGSLWRVDFEEIVRALIEHDKK
jgi:hypothetical protein